MPNVKGLNNTICVTIGQQVLAQLNEEKKRVIVRLTGGVRIESVTAILISIR